MTSIERKTIIEAIEHADCLIPHIPGYCEYATISGVLTCVTPADDPMSNKALLAHLNDKSVDGAVRQVTEYFAGKRKPFSWIVGPGSAPPDLGSRLLACGFGQPLVCHGMYLPDPGIKIDTDPSIRVSELSVDKPDAAVEIMATGFNMTLEASRSLHEIMALSANELRTRIYLAYLAGVDRAVACGYVTRFPDRPIALLCGGATLQEYRGRGAYKALLARRLRDIVRDGVNTVIVLADQRTSAPICAKVGFAKVCELQMYVWRPDNVSASN